MKKIKFTGSTLLAILALLMISSCSGKTRMDEVKVHPVFKNFAPKEQTFSINPFIQNTVKGKRGTKLRIPGKAFDMDYDDLKCHEVVEIKLIEVVDNLDFAASGIGLLYYNEHTGEEEVMESAGMFKVAAVYDNEELGLREGKKITVLFPNIVPGEKFNVYKLNSDGQWEYNGHNQVIGYDDYERPIYRKKIQKRIVAVRKYLINELTFYNFDSPRKDSACIKGSIDVDPEKLIQFYLMGISKKGYYYKYDWVKGSNFSTSFFQRTDVIIVVITEDGKIGKSKKFNTGDRWGHFRTPMGPHNYCKMIGNIKPVAVDEKILKDRKKFNKFLGLKDEKKYKTKYPK
ncbi:MAG: hypothetical protein GY754_07530 [bacterium]|nr:hypothetical protein [bacterium]